MIFIIIEVILAIVFAVCAFDRQKNIAAVFEWIIALVFTFYVLTFSIDLLPATRSKQENSNVELMHMREVENGVEMMNGDVGYTNGHVHDGANGNTYTNGATGHEGVGTGQYKAHTAQNF